MSVFYSDWFFVAILLASFGILTKYLKLHFIIYIIFHWWIKDYSMEAKESRCEIFGNVMFVIAGLTFILGIVELIGGA